MGQTHNEAVKKPRVQAIVALEPLYELCPATDRRYREVVVFVHHYGGHKHSFKKHIEFVNELGFDAVTFNLPLRSLTQLSQKVPLNKEWRFGFRHVWADKIESVLGSISANKIIFSFSSPSSAALTAIDRRNAIDIKAWVCDGGPFFNLDLGFENFLYKKKQINNPWLNKIATQFVAYIYGKNEYEKEMAEALRRLPKNFPILSLQAENDQLVQSEMIEAFWTCAETKASISRFVLPQAEHLEGYKTNPDLYKKQVADFLISHSSKV